MKINVFCVLCLFVCACVGMAMPWTTYRVKQKNAWELGFAFHSMDSENHTQITMLGGKCLHTEQTHMT